MKIKINKTLIIIIALAVIAVASYLTYQNLGGQLQGGAITSEAVLTNVDAGE